MVRADAVPVVEMNPPLASTWPTSSGKVYVSSGAIARLSTIRLSAPGLPPLLTRLTLISAFAPLVLVAVNLSMMAVQLVAKDGDFATLRLPSTEMRRVLLDCRATVGEVGNAEHELVKIGKAGRNRWKGVRPQTRGVAMNPVDHPHGGGEG